MKQGSRTLSTVSTPTDGRPQRGNMTQGAASVLIVAGPGELREGLEALVTATPALRVVAQAADIPSAVGLAKEHHPALVLLDASIAGNNISAAVVGIQTDDSPIRCLVLADHVRQQEEAEAAGAALAVVKGFPAAELAEAMRRLAF